MQTTFTITQAEHQSARALLLAAWTLHGGIMRPLPSVAHLQAAQALAMVLSGYGKKYEGENDGTGTPMVSWGATCTDSDPAPPNGAIVDGMAVLNHSTELDAVIDFVGVVAPIFEANPKAITDPSTLADLVFAPPFADDVNADDLQQAAANIAAILSEPLTLKAGGPAVAPGVPALPPGLPGLPGGPKPLPKPADVPPAAPPAAPGLPGWAIALMVAGGVVLVGGTVALATRKPRR